MLDSLRRAWRRYLDSIPREVAEPALVSDAAILREMHPSPQPEVVAALDELASLMCRHLPSERATKAQASIMRRLREPGVSAPEALARWIDTAAGPKRPNLGMVALDWKAREELNWQAKRLAAAHGVSLSWQYDLDGDAEWQAWQARGEWPVTAPLRQLAAVLAARGTALFAFEVLSDPAIYEFENAPPASVEALHARYVRQQRRGPESGDQLWLNWVIRLNAGPGAGQLAGYVQATVLPDGHALVAYELHSRHWRQGIGGAALQAMLGELALAYDVHRFMAVLKRRNFRSAGLLHKLGFEPADAKLEARFRDEADERVMTRLAAAGPR